MAGLAAVLVGLAAMAGALPAWADAPAAATVPRTLDLGLIAPPGHGMTRAAGRIADAVETATAGALRLRVHPSSRRGNEAAMLAQLGGGELDLAILTVGELARHEARLEVFFTPFLATGPADAGRLMATPSAATLALSVEDRLGVRVLGLGTLGLRHLILTKRAAGADSLAGMRIRVTPSPAIEAFHAALGADVQPLPLPAVRDMLDGEGLDGADMDLEMMAMGGYDRAAPHALLSGHMMFPVAAVVSAATWDSLAEPERQALAEAARAEMAGLAAYYKEWEPRWRATLAERGMTFLPAPRAQLDDAAARWRAAHPELDALADVLRAEARHAP